MRRLLAIVGGAGVLPITVSISIRRVWCVLWSVLNKAAGGRQSDILTVNHLCLWGVYGIAIARALSHVSIDRPC